MTNGQFETPILFMVFNRPDTTKIVFDAIKKRRPKYLYVAADGPRRNNENDIGKCAEVRKIIGQIDWPCDVHTKFQEKNLGCRVAASSAVTWFFDNVPMGIILEDDCVPHPSFFPYCEELLERYKDNKKVMHIGGNNFQDGIKRGNGSYYFSKYDHLWGWASWQRAWKQYDQDMSGFSDFEKNKTIRKIFKDKRAQMYWTDLFRDAHAKKMDTWDYPWNYAIWKVEGACITPNVNLVANIGFGNNATHTKQENGSPATISEEISFPLAHPSKMEIDIAADAYTFNHVFWKKTRKEKIKLFMMRNTPTVIKKIVKSWSRAR